MCTDVHVYVGCNRVCLSFVCVQQRPALQPLLSVAGEEDMYVRVRACTCVYVSSTYMCIECQVKLTVSKTNKQTKTLTIHACTLCLGFIST